MREEKGHRERGPVGENLNDHKASPCEGCSCRTRLGRRKNVRNRTIACLCPGVIRLTLLFPAAPDWRIMNWPTLGNRSAVVLSPLA